MNVSITTFIENASDRFMEKIDDIDLKNIVSKSTKLSEFFESVTQVLCYYSKLLLFFSQSTKNYIIPYK